jgi:AraC-like DNA-binding protein
MTLLLDTPPDPVPGAAETHWVSIRHLQRAVAYLGAQGLDSAAWLARAGIAPECLHNGDGKIGLGALERLLAIAMQELDVPCLGLDMARSITPASFGVLGHLFQASSNLGDLLASMVRFNGLMSNVGRSRMHLGPGTVTMSWDCLAGGPAFRRVSAEFILGACSAMTRALAPDLPQPVVVRFRHAAQDARTCALLEHHFDCPVHLQQPDNAIVIHASLLKRRLPHGDTELKALLEQHAHALLASRAERPSVLEDTRRQIRLALPRGAPVRHEIARRMGLSESTLHRRLQQEGTTFQAQVDTVRLQLATQTLAQGKAGTGTIAGRLGFSSPQVFARWFRRQAGLTPGQYRQQAGAAPAVAQDVQIDDPALS